MLSERYWRSHFAADPHVLGRVITIANVPLTVVGITPADFNGTQRPLAEPRDVTLPIALDPRVRGEDRLHSATNWWVQIMGRLKPGVTRRASTRQSRRRLSRTSQGGNGRISGRPHGEWAEFCRKPQPRRRAPVDCRKRQAGNLRREYQRCSRARDHRHRDGAGVAAGMRQCRQPAPFARRRSASASCPSACRWERRARG